MNADPFDTAGLRAAVLQAWQSSPTRFREDANAEEDLRLGGYRDRLLVELAQNAADAAGSDGVLRVELAGDELRVANTGHPLTQDGVAALSSLRASAKREQGSVGRFGVGFAAVLAVSDAPRVVSASGSVEFSAERTRDEAAQLSGPAEELAAREGAVPVLRLVWPGMEQPPSGFETEVRLPLRAEIDSAALFADFADQAADLLLALPALREIRVGEQVWRRADLGDDRVAVHGPTATETWLLHRSSGQLPESALSGLATEARDRTHWTVCWAVSVTPDGEPIPFSQDVLHAPTPTDERLSLPARLLASVPMEADRRRASTTAATDAILLFAAECYPSLVSKLAGEHRPLLVPSQGFPLSDVDDKLRQAVADRLRVASWLPASDGSMVAPHQAKVLDQATPELAELLREVVPGLLGAAYSDAALRKSLAALEVQRLGAAEIVELVSGVDRPPAWWQRLYAALVPIEQSDPHAREAFSALPVPLVDGRTIRGVRDVLLGNDAAQLLSTVDVSGLRVAHPDAAHSLLEKLGARKAGPAELLDAPAIREAVSRSVHDARSGVDTGPLAEAVLKLADNLAPREWLHALALPDQDGDHRRADELLLPEARLLDVFDPEFVGHDAPLAVVETEFAASWPRSLLRSIGVLDGFAVQVEEDPHRPPDGLADVEQWWAERENAQPDRWPPPRFTGIRDLDLVAEGAWPAAIRLIASEPSTLESLREQHGYSGWWIARFAVLGGQPPRTWRIPASDTLAGLYDPIPDVGLDSEQLRLAGVRADLRVSDGDDATDLMTRLGDPDRVVRAGTALRAHQVLAEAVACGVVEPGAVDPPQSVRSVSGAVVSAERAAVLDEPWVLGVLDAPLIVAGGSPDQFDAEALADLFDLPLASEEGTLQVAGDGRSQEWVDVGRVSAACELLGISVPRGSVTLHDGLRVRMADQEKRVHWWVDPAGRVHAERTPDGLGRALAWASGRWAERFTLTALLTDPDAVTLLR